MHDFAFIFRSGPALAAPELVKRNAAARAWALARRSEGVLRYPGPLENGGQLVAKDGIFPVNQEHAVAALLIITAKDLGAAVALAQSHPGLAYGTQIEVRPVKAIVPEN